MPTGDGAGSAGGVTLEAAPAAPLAARAGRACDSRRDAETVIARRAPTSVAPLRGGGVLLSIALAAGTLCLCGCDVVFHARAKVVTNDGIDAAGALLRYGEDGVVADDRGCVSISEVIHTLRPQPMEVELPGYKTAPFTAKPAEPNCFLVRLAAESAATPSVVTPVEAGSCPCEEDSGQRYHVAARFQVRAADGAALPGVEVRKTADPLRPWAFTTGADGCVGIKWIVPAVPSVSLTLEKAGYQSFVVEVPTESKNCYAVTLTPEGGAPATGAVLPPGECGCAPLSGEHEWPERPG